MGCALSLLQKREGEDVSDAAQIHLLYPILQAVASASREPSSELAASHWPILIHLLRVPLELTSLSSEHTFGIRRSAWRLPHPAVCEAQDIELVVRTALGAIPLLARVVVRLPMEYTSLASADLRCCKSEASSVT